MEKHKARLAIYGKCQIEFVLDNPTKNELKAYIALSSFQGDKDNCFPGLDEISKRAGIDKRECSAAISSLVKKEWVLRKRRFGSTNIYECLFSVSHPETPDNILKQHIKRDDQGKFNADVSKSETGIDKEVSKRANDFVKVIAERQNLYHKKFISQNIRAIKELLLMSENNLETFKEFFTVYQGDKFYGNLPCVPNRVLKAASNGLAKNFKKISDNKMQLFYEQKGFKDREEYLESERIKSNVM